MHTTHRLHLSGLSSFVRSHDDLPAFNAAYWVLTLLAAMLFNAGAFALLIGLHMTLDVFKYRDVHGKKWAKVCEGVARENVLDIALLSLGVAFATYFHSTLPLIAGLRGLVRTEITILNAVIQIAIKTHILHNVLVIVSNVHQYLERLHPRMGKGLSLVEIVSCVALTLSIALTVAAPWVLGLDNETVSRIAQDVLIPWRL